MVDIVIVNWNSGQYLNDCINAVLQSDFKDYHIHIVDNGSTDNSTLPFQGLNNISIHYQNKNIGFGKACNKVLPESEGEYILLLNPDTKIKHGTLSMAVSFMKINARYIVYGCAQMGDDGKIMRTCGRFPTLSTFCFDVLGLSNLFPNRFKNSFIRTDWDHLNSTDVDHVMGSFYLIRRKWVDKHGFMDDRYFVYLEDLDVSKRVIDTGGKIYYDHTNLIYHKGGGVSAQVKSKRLFYSLHAKHEYIKKYFSPISFLIADFLMLFPGYLIRIIAALFIKGNFIEAKEITQAYGMLYKHLFFKSQFSD